MKIQQKIIELIVAERQSQDVKWGVQRHKHGTWMLILMEEIGEAAKAILQGDTDAFVCEMVQVAAVAVVWLESVIGDEVEGVGNGDSLKVVKEVWEDGCRVSTVVEIDEVKGE